MYYNRTKDFEKQYNRLPKKIQNAFKKRLELFIEDEYHPLLRVHKLVGNYDGYESMNITSDYRALFYREGDEIIIFAFVGKHSQLYG